MIGAVRTQPRSDSTLANMDWLLVGMFLALVTIGFLNIYSVEYNPAREEFLVMDTSYTKQVMWIAISILLGVLIMLIDAHFFSTFAFGFYLATLGLLVLTLAIGSEVAGAKSWIQFGGFSLQPSELAKFATALAMAKFLNIYGVEMRNWRHMLIGFGILLLPVVLVLLQNDTGSALVFLSLVLVLYREGLNAFFIVIPLVLGVLFVCVLAFGASPVLAVLVGLLVLTFNFLARRLRFGAAALIFLVFGMGAGIIYGTDYAFNNILQPHQRSRIEVLLGKQNDLQGAGYNLHQSLIAIGSGGATGKGFLEGTQTKFHFVPEQNTDFIFCTVGEEWGFAGTAAVVLLFVLMLVRVIFRAEKQKSTLVRAYGYGVVSILFIHFLINIGMTIGLVPVIGIPLPFISYGGSSLLGFTFLLFLFIKLDADFRWRNT